MQADEQNFGTPKRVITTAQDPRRRRLSPTGLDTPKAYMYNCGEQITKGDHGLYKGKAVIVKAGAAGDTEDPSVRLENGKAPKASMLTFVRRATPVAAPAFAFEKPLANLVSLVSVYSNSASSATTAVDEKGKSEADNDQEEYPFIDKERVSSEQFQAIVTAVKQLAASLGKATPEK
jgi:hypothetical protein